jgi:hypothetical protein
VFSVDRPIRQIGRGTLTPIVQRALGRDTAEIVDWEVGQVHGGFVRPQTGSSAVYRVVGTALDGGEHVPWSVILKLSRVAKHESDLHAWLWNSEPFVYESGLLDNLPGDFAAPRCFGVDQRAEDLYAIWTEDVVEEVGADWPLERYALAARHLGHLNGTFILPTSSWAS